jgi:hypothetical protein
MKIIKKKNRHNGAFVLIKVSNSTAKQHFKMNPNTDPSSAFVYSYSTKGAWKSRQNTLKKQAKIERRIYFRKRRLAKTA